MRLFVSGQVEGQQLVKLAAVNSRPKSGQERKQSPPVLTIVELEHKLRKKVNNLGKFFSRVCSIKYHHYKVHLIRVTADFCVKVSGHGCGLFPYCSL